MSTDRVIIGHEDGRRYSVTPEAFDDRYREQGFTVEGPESPSDFVADVPRPAERAGRKRNAPRRRRASTTEDTGGADGG